MQVSPKSVAGWSLFFGGICCSLAFSPAVYAQELPDRTASPLPTCSMVLATEEIYSSPEIFIDTIHNVPTVEVEPESKPLPASVPVLLPTSPAELTTSWGYGLRENKYNATILKATGVWPHKELHLHPILLKSLIAAESAFDPLAVSYTGAAGLTQLTPETARRFGLNWSSSRDPQQAVPAGVKVLAEKAAAILEPANYYKVTGQRPENCQYAFQVAQAYEQYGDPNADQAWHLVLGAYNGGGGTILRAMAYAYQKGLDPREWSNLVGNKKAPSSTPLYLACRDIFGSGAATKYRELSEYPIKIMKKYHTVLNTHQINTH